MAFSPDGRYLAVQGGGPDWPLALWLWEKSKLCGLYRPTQVLCCKGSYTLAQSAIQHQAAATRLQAPCPPHFGQCVLSGPEWLGDATLQHSPCAELKTPSQACMVQYTLHNIDAALAMMLRACSQLFKSSGQLTTCLCPVRT